MKEENPFSKVSRVGLYGGAFDPVHNAHIAVARHALVSAELDVILFLPAAQSPLKATGPQVSDLDRLAMLRLALQNEPLFAVEDHELDRGGISYTVDTVKHFKEKLPDAELFWIIGADQFELLARWRSIEELVTMLTFIVFSRPGSKLGDSEVEGLRYIKVEAPEMTESSSEIREKCKKKENIRGLVPDELEAFILERGLYTTFS